MKVPINMPLREWQEYYRDLLAVWAWNADARGDDDEARYNLRLREKVVEELNLREGGI